MVKYYLSCKNAYYRRYEKNNLIIISNNSSTKVPTTDEVLDETFVSTQDSADKWAYQKLYEALRRLFYSFTFQTSHREPNSSEI